MYKVTEQGIKLKESSLEEDYSLSRKISVIKVSRNTSDNVLIQTPNSPKDNNNDIDPGPQGSVQVENDLMGVQLSALGSKEKRNSRGSPKPPPRLASESQLNRNFHIKKDKF